MLIIKDIFNNIKYIIYKKNILSYNVDLRDRGKYRRLWIHCVNGLQYDLLFTDFTIQNVLNDIIKNKKVIRETGDWEIFLSYENKNNEISDKF